MSMRRTRGIWGVCFSLTLCGLALHPAHAQQGGKDSATKAGATNTFVSPRGFSISYPSHWVVASKDQSEQLSAKAKPLLDRLGVKDLSKLAILILSSDGKAAVANVNMTIVESAIPVSEENKPNMRGVISQIEKATGIPLKDVRITIEKFAGRPTFVARYNLTMNNVPMSQMQIYIPNKDKTYITTSTAAQTEMSRFEPTFREIVNSIKFK